MSWSKWICFAGGALFGTAGLRALGSRDAKKTYTHAAAALRAKDCLLDAATKVREGAENVYEDAKRINAERAAAEDGASIENQA